MDWYDEAYEELENDLENGLLTEKQFSIHMRDLNEEYDDQRKNMMIKGRML